MKDKKTVKVGAVSPKIRLGDVGYNVKACIKEASRAAELGVRVLVFPELTLTGATCGDLFEHYLFADRAERGLADFVEATRELDLLSFVGLPAELDGLLYNTVAAVYRGELIGVAVKNDLSYDQERYFYRMDRGIKRINIGGLDTVYLREGVLVSPIDEGTVISIGLVSNIKKEGVSIAVCPEAIGYIAGDREEALSEARVISGVHGIAYVTANAGIGESTTDAVYAANNIIADRGEIICEALPFAKDNLIVADVVAEKAKYNPDFIHYDEDDEEEIENPNPFLPINKDEQKEVCLEALEIQAQALAARVERSYSRSMVIGVSGGLDSTLALLVCARAADILGMDRRNVLGVTMPCFGTTKRTKSNAEKLSEALGISFRTVDIKASVTQHLKDIGHDGVTTDVTFENAQARERTQVLMDISNMMGGLVVGTGDLSELVLGWATYNGDHMSMYSVNASVPKTMVRRIVEVYSDNVRIDNPAISEVLDDILATPVSPELLPPKDGEIAQCTEELVGPYELHDFFIACILGSECSVWETYDRAVEAFHGVYDKKTILGWLRVFVKRFFSQQFKRSCMPDGPKVSFISVSPRSGLHMPSDMSSAVWLEELDEIERQEK